MEKLNKTEILRQSLYQIKRLKQELKAATSRESIAVIGMACRFPGGSTTPEKFWALFEKGEEGLCDIPQNRWDSRMFYDAQAGKPLKMYIQQSNFLKEDVSQFDPKLFGISPREAEEIDPQHRLLLELTWEALERAGLAPHELKGQAVGTFIGVIFSEYGMLTRDPRTISPYTMTGLTNHMASGRIAHVFGFQGPALSIDTACSSSLVSIHQACESLRNNECQLALAGGVGLMLSPVPFINLCKLQALAIDGRCKPFSTSADGYGRGEGAGVIVLKQLSAAQRDRDPILAVIAGSTINHDGPSSGLTVPNGQAQKKLLQDAFRQSGIQPKEMGYVEVHGTGTPLGDPIEFQSLKHVFSENRDENNPLILGTCKANIGHLEAAAGVAGVIKTIMCLQNKIIPRHINCDEINPRVQLETLPAVLPTSSYNWKAQNSDSSRVAGVSSFGFSGTNAFVILKEAPENSLDKSKFLSERPKHILSLSAQTQQALSELAERYIAFLSDDPRADIDILSVAFTANTGRSHFSWRMACVWADLGELLSSLNVFHQTKKTDNKTYYSDCSVEKKAKITMIFPNTISSDLSIIVPFLNYNASFQDSWRRCEKVFQPHSNQSLTDLLNQLAVNEQLSVNEQGTPISYLSDSESLDNASLVFSVSYSMFQLCQYLGIQINTAYAEGDGLYALAAATGMLPLEEAIDDLVHRYSLKQDNHDRSQTRKLSMPRIRVLLPGRSAPLSRTDLTDTDLLENAYDAAPNRHEIRNLFHEENHIACELNTAPRLLEKIYGEKLAKMNYSTVLQLGSAWEGVLHLIAKCYSAGHTINWKHFDEGFPREKVLCPTYPFQRRSYWIETIPDPLFTPSNLVQKTPQGNTLSASSSPLAGVIQSSPLKAKQVLFTLSTENLPSLKDAHNIVHVGHFLELLHSGLQLCRYTNSRILGMAFDVVLLIPEDQEKTIQLTLEEQDEAVNFTFHSLNRASDQWIQHIHGSILVSRTAQDKLNKLSLQSIQKKLVQQQSGLVFYQEMQERGITLGPSVQWIEQVWRKDGEALARFRLARENERVLSYQLRIHPGVWDACAQLFHATLNESVAKDSRFMVTQLGNVQFQRPELTPTVWCHVISTGKACEEGVLAGEFTLYTDNDEVIAFSQGYQMKELTAAHLKVFENSEEQRPRKTNDALLSAIEKTESKEEQVNQIKSYIQATLAALLKIPHVEISLTESIINLGVDSLVGLEFKSKIEAELGVIVEIAVFLQGPTITELGLDIHRHLGFDVAQKELTSPHLRETVVQETVATPGFSFSNYSLEKKKWLRGNRKKQAVLRLYCFPYGGGTVSLYRNWVKKFPDEIEVQPIQLPGRQDRLTEMPIEVAEEIAEKLTQIVENDSELPFAIYGHSAGALVAYVWARHLQITGKTIPQRLIVGGFTAPSIPNPYLKIMKAQYQKCGFEHIPTLRQLLGSPQKVINKLKNGLDNFLTIPEIQFTDSSNQSLLHTLLPMLIADSQLVDTFVAASAIPLDIPIVALHGEEDERVTFDEMQSWKTLTTKLFSIKIFSGDHFFLHTEQNEQNVIAYISDVLMNTQEDYIEQRKNI